jgi:hypothetical protein
MVSSFNFLFSILFILVIIIIIILSSIVIEAVDFRCSTNPTTGKYEIRIEDRQFAALNTDGIDLLPAVGKTDIDCDIIVNNVASPRIWSRFDITGDSSQIISITNIECNFPGNCVQFEGNIKNFDSIVFSNMILYFDGSLQAPQMTDPSAVRFGKNVLDVNTISFSYIYLTSLGIPLTDDAYGAIAEIIGTVQNINVFRIEHSSFTVGDVTQNDYVINVADCDSASAFKNIGAMIFDNITAEIFNFDGQGKYFVEYSVLSSSGAIQNVGSVSITNCHSVMYNINNVVNFLHLLLATLGTSSFSFVGTITLSNNSIITRNVQVSKTATSISSNVIGQITGKLISNIQHAIIFHNNHAVLSDVTTYWGSSVGLFLFGAQGTMPAAQNIAPISFTHNSYITRNWNGNYAQQVAEGAQGLGLFKFNNLTSVTVKSNFLANYDLNVKSIAKTRILAIDGAPSNLGPVLLDNNTAMIFSNISGAQCSAVIFETSFGFTNNKADLIISNCFVSLGPSLMAADAPIRTSAYIMILVLMYSVNVINVKNIVLVNNTVLYQRCPDCDFQPENNNNNEDPFSKHNTLGIVAAAFLQGSIQNMSNLIVNNVSVLFGGNHDHHIGLVFVSVVYSSAGMTNIGMLKLSNSLVNAARLISPSAFVIAFATEAYIINSTGIEVRNVSVFRSTRGSTQTLLTAIVLLRNVVSVGSPPAGYAHFDGIKSIVLGNTHLELEGLDDQELSKATTGDYVFVSSAFVGLLVLDASVNFRGGSISVNGSSVIVNNIVSSGETSTGLVIATEVRAVMNNTGSLLVENNSIRGEMIRVSGPTIGRCGLAIFNYGLIGPSSSSVVSPFTLRNNNIYCEISSVGEPARTFLGVFGFSAKNEKVFNGVLTAGAIDLLVEGNSFEFVSETSVGPARLDATTVQILGISTSPFKFSQIRMLNNKWKGTFDCDYNTEPTDYSYFFSFTLQDAYFTGMFVPNTLKELRIESSSYNWNIIQAPQTTITCHVLHLNGQIENPALVVSIKNNTVVFVQQTISSDVPIPPLPSSGIGNSKNVDPVALLYPRSISVRLFYLSLKWYELMNYFNCSSVNVSGNLVTTDSSTLRVRTSENSIALFETVTGNLTFRNHITVSNNRILNSLLYSSKNSYGEAGISIVKLQGSTSLSNIFFPVLTFTNMSLSNNEISGVSFEIEIIEAAMYFPTIVGVQILLCLNQRIFFGGAKMTQKPLLQVVNNKIQVNSFVVRTIQLLGVSARSVSEILAEDATALWYTISPSALIHASFPNAVADPKYTPELFSSWIVENNELTIDSCTSTTLPCSVLGVAVVTSGNSSSYMSYLSDETKLIAESGPTSRLSTSNPTFSVRNNVLRLRQSSAPSVVLRMFGLTVNLAPYTSTTTTQFTVVNNTLQLDGIDRALCVNASLNAAIVISSTTSLLTTSSFATVEQSQIVFSTGLKRPTNLARVFLSVASFSSPFVWPVVLDNVISVNSVTASLVTSLAPSISFLQYLEAPPSSSSSISATIQFVGMVHDNSIIVDDYSVRNLFNCRRSSDCAVIKVAPLMMLLLQAPPPTVSAIVSIMRNNMSMLRTASMLATFNNSNYYYYSNYFPFATSTSQFHFEDNALDTRRMNTARIFASGSDSIIPSFLDSHFFFACNNWTSFEQREFGRVVVGSQRQPATSSTTLVVTPSIEVTCDRLLWTSTRSLERSPSRSQQPTDTHSAVPTESLSRNRVSLTAADTRSQLVTESRSLVHSPSQSVAVSNSRERLMARSSTVVVPKAPRDYSASGIIFQTSLLSTITAIGVASVDPAAAVFIQKMKILATPCGEDEPFLPPLGWDANPTRVQLGADRDGLNLPMYYGSMVMNAVLLYGVLLLGFGGVLLYITLFTESDSARRKRLRKEMKENEKAAEKKSASSKKQKNKASKSSTSVVVVNVENLVSSENESESVENKPCKKKDAKKRKSTSNDKKIDDDDVTNKKTKKEQEKAEQKKSVATAANNSGSIFKRTLDTLARFNYPGYIMHVMMRVLLPPSVFAVGVMIATHPRDAGTIGAIAFAFVSFIVLPFSTVLIVARRYQSTERLMRNRAMLSAAKFKASCRTLVYPLTALVIPQRVWEIENRPMVQHFGMLFRNAAFPLFVAFDIAIDVVVASTAGYAALASRQMCEAVRYITLIACLLHFAAAIRVRPSLSVLMSYLAPLMSLMALIFSIMALVAFYTKNASSSTTNNFLIFAATVSAFASIDALLKVILRLYLSRFINRDDEEEKEQSESNGQVPQLDQVLSSNDDSRIELEQELLTSPQFSSQSRLLDKKRSSKRNKKSESRRNSNIPILEAVLQPPSATTSQPQREVLDLTKIEDEAIAAANRKSFSSSGQESQQHVSNNSRAEDQDEENLDGTPLTQEEMIRLLGGGEESA